MIEFVFFFHSAPPQSEGDHKQQTVISFKMVLDSPFLLLMATQYKGGAYEPENCGFTADLTMMWHILPQCFWTSTPISPCAPKSARPQTGYPWLNL